MLGSYPGAKAAAGVAHRIIGQMPPHENYFELFLGHGSIIRAKARAPSRNVGTDVDGRVIRKWRELPWPASEEVNDLEIVRADALQILTSDPALRNPRTLVYLDPPYLRSTRTRRLYRREFWTEAQHRELIRLLLPLPCMVMLSCYPSPLYATMLQGWRFVAYTVVTRGGLREERLYCNFPEPAVLHDPRFGGSGYRDRERVKRKRARWAAKFERLPAWERQLVRAALDDAEAAAGSRDVAPVETDVVRSPRPYLTPGRELAARQRRLTNHGGRVTLPPPCNSCSPSFPESIF